ncbi:MAG: PKD domain-containing protein [Bacteroidia bacterium]
MKHTYLIQIRRLYPTLRNFCYLGILLSCLAAQAQHTDKPTQIPRWLHTSETMPGHIQAFEENLGQYANPLNTWNVKYVCNTGGTTILFTDKGLIYSTLKPEIASEAAEEDEEKAEAREMETPVYDRIAMEWPGANPGMSIEAVDETPYFFSSSNAIDPSIALNHIRGFRKLIYHDVYPGIDIIYTFHPTTGIKYTLQVKPGTDAQTFSMRYAGQEGLKLDKHGDLHIRTSLGDILDHAPVTATLSGTAISSSFVLKSDKEIGFRIQAGEAKNGLIIDPWTITPLATVPATFVPTFVGMDASNNVYITGIDGGTRLTYTQKYAAATGALLWTYPYNEYGTGSWVAGLAVDPAGNTYVGQPKGSHTNTAGVYYEMVCVNTAGIRVYYYNTYSVLDIYETLTLSYSCNSSVLVEAGSRWKGAAGNVTYTAVMNPANGNVGAVSADTLTGEVYGGTIAPNGNYYCLAVDSNSNGGTGTATTGKFNNLRCYTVTGATITPSWKLHVDYNLQDYKAKSGPKSLSLNGVGAGCAYLYTTDGVSLDQRSLTTGALVRRVTIPGGSNSTLGNMNGGVAVDLKCGYVYVGSVNAMYCYDANLNPVFTYSGLPGIVYDVYYLNGFVSCTGATAGNVAFVAQFPAQTCTNTLTKTDPTCGASNGTATAHPTFCSGPYTYLWTPSGQTTQTATGLPAGLYTVQIGTGSACVTSSDTITLRAASGGTEAITGTNVSCAGGTNGTATTTMTGGTSPFTYSWSPSGGTAATATGLGAGTYTCSVTDNGGCTTTQTVIITAPAPLALTNTQTNVLCNGGTNGSATVTASGGTAPYTYSWSPSGGTAATATGLAAGTYTCTLTDSKACATTSVVTITQPAALTATTSTVPALCGSSNGSATVTAGGGTTAYTYSWNTTPAQTTATATGLAAGTITCTVTDANGCVQTATANVTNTGGPSVTAAPPVNVTCFGACNGSGNVTVTGGTAPYTYTWSPAPGAGQGSNAASALCAGTYTCNVADNTGCVQSATLIITQPTALTLTPASTPVACFGGNTGSASVTASGGSAAYTYSWTPAPGAGQGSANATNLTAGNYTLQLTDANGCKDSTVIAITQPALLTINATGLTATCNGKCNGQLICVPNGGTSAYSYSWNTGCSSASCSNICAGTYTATVTDSHGCTATDTALVHEPPPLAMTMGSKPSICNKPDGKDSVKVTGGTAAYTYSWTPGPGNTTANYTNIVAGTYTVYVQDNNGCRDSSTNIVSNMPGVNITNVASTPVSCFGGNDGTARDSASVGYKPYTYNWTPAPGGGQGTASASGLSAGTYTCTVTDSAGCTNAATVTIIQPPQLVLTAMTPVTICIGQCTPLTATANGGSPLYTYSWTQGGTGVTSPVCPVVTTTYTVAVTDSHGCTIAPLTVVITVNPPLEVTTGNATVCPGTATTLNATGSGGNGNLTYQWIPTTGLSNPNIANPVATPATTTIYTVIVSDNCGTPTDSAFATVTLFPATVVSFTALDSVHCAPVCAHFTGTSTPACASAVWNFGDGTTGTGCGTAVHCYYIAGTYTVSYSVTDINGCKGSKSIPNFINALPVPEAAFTYSPNPATIIDPTVHFTDASTNAVSWNWTFGDVPSGTSTLPNPVYAYRDTGCYPIVLIVTGSNGCTDTAKAPVCVEPDFTFYAPNTFTPNGDGKNDEWMPFGTGIDVNNYHLMLFDRWGNLIFETYKWDQGWDGRANGGANIAQIDTYVWKVDLKDFKHNPHHYRGHCNLIK